ncbi:MAG: DNA alkylation repair protein [bacterium]|nr:DNA alkylation repair protein [bacterium]
MKSLENRTKANILKSFFKTSKGEYGENDIFLGIDVPTLRKIARENSDLDLKNIKKLLTSKYHEIRLFSLLILIKKFEEEADLRNDILNLYLKNTKYINNWDLVDISSYKIVGRYSFENNDHTIIEKLSSSKNMWERRIAIVSLLYFIKNSSINFPLKILKKVIDGKEDLIKKAIGWMLREIGKISNESVVENFIVENYDLLSPLTINYATERFEISKRKNLLKGLKKRQNIDRK